MPMPPATMPQIDDVRRRLAPSTAEPRPRLSRQRSDSRDRDAGPLCPITQEPISAYQRDKVHITLDGVAYHHPSLKLWMSQSNTLPHRGLNPQAEIDRLWPQGGVGPIPPLSELMQVAGLGLSAVGLACIMPSIYYIEALGLVVMPAELHYAARLTCTDAADIMCVSKITHELSAACGWRPDYPHAALALGVALGLILGGLTLYTQGQHFDAERRPVSRAERRAALGVRP